MTNPPAIVTLTTDFGLKDEYVASLKGVLLAHDAHIVLVDITHDIPPQQVSSAAHILNRATPFFPPETIHLAVVDPGVGTDRKLIAARCHQQYFVGPDNGIFHHIFKDSAPEIHLIEPQSIGCRHHSNTFHGRDLLAPAAARLATGIRLVDIGPPFPNHLTTPLADAEPLIFHDRIEGKVIHVDHFGNLCTNISRDQIEKAAFSSDMIIQLSSSIDLSIVSSCYSDVPVGTMLALFDSHDMLEISVRNESCSTITGITTGAPVVLHARRR